MCWSPEMRNDLRCHFGFARIAMLKRRQLYFGLSLNHSGQTYIGNNCSTCRYSYSYVFWSTDTIAVPLSIRHKRRSYRGRGGYPNPGPPPRNPNPRPRWPWFGDVQSTWSSQSFSHLCSSIIVSTSAEHVRTDRCIQYYVCFNCL